MNRNGTATASLVRQLEETQAMIEERGPMRPEGDNAPMIASFEEKIEEGCKYALAWQDAIHYGPDVPPRAALAFKREWNAWGKGARTFDRLIRSLLELSPDELEVVLDEMYPTE